MHYQWVKIMFTVYLVVVMLSSILIIHSMIVNISNALREEKKKENKCWICLKDKESIEKNGCIF